MISRQAKNRAEARQRPPLMLVVPAMIGGLLFLLPLAGLIGRAPWSTMPEILTRPTVTDALVLSLITSVAAAGCSLVLGLPLAFVLARTSFRGRSVIRALVTLPMVLPPVVGGVALLMALGRRGLVGEPLAEATGLVLPFSIWGVIVANTFVAMPFLVVTIEGALGNADQRIERAAATLGAGPLAVFWRVTIPTIAPALRAGMVLAWARALGEFGATITFAGNLSGRTQTLPLAVFVSLQSNAAERQAALVMSLLLVVVSLVVLIGLRDRWWSGR